LPLWESERLGNETMAVKWSLSVKSSWEASPLDSRFRGNDERGLEVSEKDRRLI